MIVCHCEVVSDSDVRDHAAGGAVTVDDVAERCGAGAACGGCVGRLGEIVAAVHAGASARG